MKRLKKILLVSLVAGSLSTIGLTSCDNTPATSADASVVASSEEASVEETTSVPNVSRIVVKTPETDPKVGETINLDDFVTVYSDDVESNVFTATVKTEDTVTLTDHILTVIAEGDITVEITEGVKTSLFRATAVSEILGNYIEDTASIGKNYFLELLYTDDTSGELSGTNAGWLHNENYFGYYEGVLQGGEDLFTGILEAGSGDSYNYTMDDRAGTNLVVEPGKQSDLGLYYLAAAFPDLTSELSTNEAGTGLDIADGADFELNSLGVQFGEGDDIAWGVSYEDVLLGDATETAKTLVFTLYYNGAADWQLALETDEASYTCQAIEDYRTAGTLPETLKVDELATKADEIAATTNYTMDFKAGFFNYSDGSAATMESDGGLPTINETTYVDENTIYTYDKDSGAAFGSTIEEGKAYNFTNIVDGVATTTITKTEDTEATTVTDIAAYASDKVVTALSADGLLTGLNVTGKETAEDGTISASGTGEDDNAFILAVASLNNGADFTDWFQQTFTDGVTTFADGTDWEVTIAEDTLEVKLSLNWDGTVAYVLDFNFNDFGATTVPFLTDDVVLPVTE